MQRGFLKLSDNCIWFNQLCIITCTRCKENNGPDEEDVHQWSKQLAIMSSRDIKGNNEALQAWALEKKMKSNCQEEGSQEVSAKGWWAGRECVLKNEKTEEASMQAASKPGKEWSS